MFEQVRWQRVAWLPVAAGLLWLWCAARAGVIGFVVSLLPGCLLIAVGVSTLLYAGDSRIPQFVALGGVIGNVVACADSLLSTRSGHCSPRRPAR